MRHWYQAPHPQLSTFLKTVLVLEGFAPPDEAGPLLFTGGMPALLCRTEKDPAGHENTIQLSLFGKSAPAGDWEIGATVTLIAYFFKPFALPVIFNLAASRLKKAPVALSQWDPHKTNALRTQLSYAATSALKIAALDHLLLTQLQQHQKECEVVRYATDRIMSDPATEVVPGLLKELGMHQRTFHRLFKKYVGVTPGQYRRICQFQLSFAQLKGGQFNQMTDVAFDNGFADQSHFIRSFKEFTDTTPHHYLRFGLNRKKP